MRSDASRDHRRSDFFSVSIAQGGHDVDSDRELVIDPGHIVIIGVTFYDRQREIGFMGIPGGYEAPFPLIEYSLTAVNATADLWITAGHCSKSIKKLYPS
jgi:hypothetical protein